MSHHDAVPVQVRRAQPADLPAIRSVLALVLLAHDPLMDWIFGAHPRREEAVAAFLWAPIESYTVAGTTWVSVVAGRAVGAAAWSVPNAPPAAVDGGPALPGRSMVDLLLPPEHVATVRAGFQAMQGQLPDEPHALLHLLGVDADHRGRGVGAALVATALAAIPADLPAHVNTTVDTNVRFDEGFSRF